MIVLERKQALLMFGLTAIALVPFLFQSFPQVPIGLAFVPIVVAAEAAIYVLFSMIARPEGGWGGAASVAGLLVVLRLALCFIGAVLLSFSPRFNLMIPGVDPTLVNLQGGERLGLAMRSLYSGNPLGILTQMMLQLALAPHLILPMLGGRDFSSDQASSHDEPRHASYDPTASALPVGGYVSVYSYQELTEFLRKVSGLEGFLFYSDEGLKMLGDFQFSINEDALALNSHRMMDQLQTWAARSNLQSADSLLIQSTDRYAAGIVVNPRVRLLLFFTKSTPVEIVLNRTEMIRKTAAEFLRSRANHPQSTTTAMK